MNKLPFTEEECVQIHLLYKLIVGSLPTESLSVFDTPGWREVLALRYARLASLHGKSVAIATLEGARAFQKYFNSLSLMDAIRQYRMLFPPPFQ